MSISHTRNLMAVGLLLVSSFASPALAQAPTRAMPAELRPYQLVLFQRGPNAGMPSPDVVQRHLVYMRKLNEQGRVVVYGPTTDNGTIAGIIVMDAESPAAARQLLEQDEMVKAGYVTFAVHAVMLPSLAGVKVKYQPDPT